MQTSDHEPYDLLIVGGGINGAGIAADAAGRGLRVALLEAEDFASGTSSASSKLIHGGLRYLEHYEFRLVREALAEREVMLRKAPHIVWPLRFVLPVTPGMRPPWMLRAGLFLYDHLARRTTLPGSKSLDLRGRSAEYGFAPDLERAFAYSDCWVDDARLVIENILQAREHGADILARTRFVEAKRLDGLWRVTARSRDRQADLHLSCRGIVNAAGPWVEGVCDAAGLTERDFIIRRIKGSHIVVPRVHAGDHGAFLQLPDRRILVVMPFEERYSLVGTTDVETFDHAMGGADASPEEVDYLLDAINRYFARKTAPEKVVWSYAGIRPLHEGERTPRDAPATISRDYAFRIDQREGDLPLLTVLGGKLTTYRRLAEHALGELSAYFPLARRGRTEDEILPGGRFGEGGRAGFCSMLARRYPRAAPATLARYVRVYGSRAMRLMERGGSRSDFGASLGGGLTETEVEFLIDEEWACDPASILWRRTKTGLHMSIAERERATAAIEAACRRKSHKDA